jgi:4-hydroxy-tetrahydrodipicolinate reductase
MNIRMEELMTNIILRGCNGKMGQLIADMVEQDESAVIIAGVDIAAGRTSKYPVYKSFTQCKEKADVIVDFSSPAQLDEMLEFARRNRTGIVLCTTGFSAEDLAMIEETAAYIPILKSPNMSMGINLMLKLVKEAARVLSDAGFDIEIVEKHHNKKLDAPSGTALSLANTMNEVFGMEYEYKSDRTRERAARSKKEIGISVVRGGTIVGEHEVIFAGTDEVIEIKHTAYSRAVFARGAIQAAKFLPGRKPGLYTMKDVLG